MSAFSNELKENFTPKEQRKNTAQTTLPREIIAKFANRRSDWEGFKQLTFHVSFILFSQFLVYYTTHNTNTDYYYLKYFLFHLPAQIFCGYTISFLFMGVHETVHHTAFKTPIYNMIVEYTFGFACFRPPMHYRYYHWAHHRFTGNKSKDPELYSTWIEFDIADSFINYIVYMSGIPFWIDRITCLLRHSTLFIFDNIFACKLNSTVQNILLPKQLEYYLQLKERRYNVSLEALFFIMSYLVILIFFDVGFLWKYWFLPSLIGQVFLRGYLLAEHRNCTGNTNMFSNSRTTNTFWLQYKLAWMMPWHIEHHSFPYVPFYLLKELHQKLVEHCGDENKFYAKSGCKPDGNDGYLSVHRQVLYDIFNKEK